MAGIRLFNVHRTWEDWLGICLGALIMLTPWIAGQVEDQAIVYNAALVGVLVMTLAAFELVDLRRWEESGEIALGAWLMVSPFVFGYAGGGELRFWHFALGAVVAAVASLELWQDWKLNDKELARHGQ